MKLGEIAFRNISRNRRRSILSGAAIAISVLTIVCMSSMMTGMANDLKENVFKYVTGQIRIRNSEYEAKEYLFPLRYNIKNSESVIGSLLENPDVRVVTPRIQFGTSIYGSARITLKDVKDFEALKKFLKDDPSGLALFFREKIAKDGLAVINSSEPLSDGSKIILLDAINKTLTNYRITDFVSPDKLGILTAESSSNEDSGSIVKLTVNRKIVDSLLSAFINKSKASGKNFNAIGYGVDFNREKDFLDFDKALFAGELPSQANGPLELVLSSGLADQMNITTGDKLTLQVITSQNSGNSMTFRVKGIVVFPVDMFNSKLFFMSIQTAQKLLYLSGSATELLVYVKNEKKLNKTVKQLTGSLNSPGSETISVKPWTVIGSFYTYFSMMNIAYVFIGLFFFILGTTVIVNTTMMVIYERMREIGTIAALGMKGKEIVHLFFLESFYIAAVAAFIGVILGSAIMLPFSKFGIDFGSMMKGVQFQISSMIYPVIDIGNLFLTFIYAVFISSVASIIPSRHAAKIQPVEALRSI